MPEPCFLVVRLSSLGDIVHTFPAVAGLRESFPKSEIVWLTHPRWQALVENSQLATEIWTAESRSLASVREVIVRTRKKKFFAAIDYQGLWKSAALPFLGGVRRRIGFSAETVREFGVPILYTDRVHSRAAHITEQNGELSLRAGARNGLAPFTLVSSTEETFVLHLLQGLSIDGYVVLSPGGGWRSKCWPADRYGALCKEILERLGLRCVLNYGPGEEDLIAAVKAASGKADPVAYNGSLGQLMALLRNAACLVAGDTGPLHLAVALGTPVVALFGPTDPARNGPYNSHDIVLRAKDVVTTYARNDQAHPSMLAIRVDAVLDAVCRRMEAAK
jgi:ADP-heptose:LPS heptosyltransferase